MKKQYLIIVFFVSILNVQAQVFVDVSAANDISVGYGSGAYGGGVSFVDFNDDGWDDLSFASEDGDAIHLYQNNSGVFTKITTPTIFTLCESKQLIWADYDNDGDKDLFVTCNEGQNRLYQNDGSFNFTDVTSSVNLPTQDDPTYGATFGDYDLDGWLDLYVCNYTEDVFINQLFKNNNGSFTDVTTSAQVNTSPDFSFAATFLDFNNDSWPDIYVAIDKYYNNLLFKNNGDGTFSDISISSGAGIVVDAMNSGVGDIDNDGDLDIYVTNSPPGNELLINNGNETFTESGATCGVALYKISWAGNFFDCDNDGDFDLYVSTTNMPGEVNHQMYVNEGSCNFDEYDGDYSGDAEPGFSHTCGDFNNDGLTDLALSQDENIDFLLLENQSDNSNNWIKVKLVGTESNKDGIGSWIEIWINGNKQVRYTVSGTGYLNQNSMVEHIGVGTNSSIDSIVVRWPSGNVNKLLSGEIGPLNNTLTIEESAGPLAVDWLSFKAYETSRQTAQLEWSTASETDNLGYEIQKSIDGIYFEAVAWIQGNGTVNDVSEYSYEDKIVEKMVTYYYRIKQEDTDGSFEYSKITSLYIGSGNEIIIGEFNPNPARSGLVNMPMVLFDEAAVSISIFNLDGRMVLEKYTIQSEGQQNVTVDLQNIPAGVYIAKIRISENLCFFRKLVVSN